MPKITPHFCEIFGAIMGDGNLWTDGSRYRIDLTGDPRNDRNYFLYLHEEMRKVFNKEPYAMKVHYGGLVMRLQSKKAFAELTELGMPHGFGKARKVKIPKAIIRSGWECSKWVIRGFADTDGTLFFSKKTYRNRIYPTIELDTMSRMLAMQVWRLLNSNGFRSRVRGNHTRGYTVALYGKQMLLKWMRDVGFSNDKHIEKFETYKKLYIN